MSESYSLELLDIVELVSVRAVGTAGCSKMGFQGRDKFAPKDGSFAGGGVGAGRSPGLAYQTDEREGGR